MGFDYNNGMDLSTYQLTLVVILVLNLVFWLLVIVWRFCYLRRLNSIVESRRADLRGELNDAMENTEGRNAEDLIYTLAREDFPPSYDDAVKSHPVFPYDSFSTDQVEATQPPGYSTATRSHTAQVDQTHQANQDTTASCSPTNIITTLNASTLPCQDGVECSQTALTLREGSQSYQRDTHFAPVDTGAASIEVPSEATPRRLV